jgi:hypothetical protein
MEVGGFVHCETKVDVMKPVTYAGEDYVRLGLECLIIMMNLFWFTKVLIKVHDILTEQPTRQDSAKDSAKKNAKIIGAFNEDTMAGEQKQPLVVKFQSGRTQTYRRMQLEKKSGTPVKPIWADPQVRQQDANVPICMMRFKSITLLACPSAMWRLARPAGRHRRLPEPRGGQHRRHGVSIVCIYITL